MTNTLDLHLNSLADMDRLGKLLARKLPDGSTIALVGTLGAGKTRLVQATGAACGLPPGSVTSPTFVLCQFYYGDRSICHIDAYRISDLDEFLELGVDEIFGTTSLTFVEWGDRVEQVLPEQRITVEIQVLGPQKRLVCLRVSDSYRDVLGEITRGWSDVLP